MYATHFGLRELPFNNTPDPHYFCATPDHEEALASLIYTVSELKGYVLLTGEVGAGKTLVSRMMLRHFGNRISSAVINNTNLGAEDLLAAVCSEFDLDPPPAATRFGLFKMLQDHLLAQFAANRPAVLVLDEGQNLPDEAFEQLRMIGNLEADDAKLLQMVILGQIELRDRFGAPGMRQLRQRIFRSFHLPALSPEVCADYIRHRLTVARAGTSAGRQGREATDLPQVFDDEAIDVIYHHSEGLPRLINTLCDNAMLAAYAADRHQIDAEMMQSVAAQVLGPEPAGTTLHRSSSLPVTNAPANRPHEPTATPEVPRQDILELLEPRLTRLEVRASEIAERTRRLAMLANNKAGPPDGPTVLPAAAQQDARAKTSGPGRAESPDLCDHPDVEAHLSALINRASSVLNRDADRPQPQAADQGELEEPDPAVGAVWPQTDQSVGRVNDVSRVASRTGHRLIRGTETHGAGHLGPSRRRLQELLARSRTSLDALRNLVRQTDPTPPWSPVADTTTFRRVGNVGRSPNNDSNQQPEAEIDQRSDCPTAALARRVGQLADLADETIETF